MQSITWEAIRGLFPDVFKKPKNNTAVNNVWNEYRHGRIDQNEARQRTLTLAGGIENPTWFRPSGPNEEGGSSYNEGELPVGGVRGKAPEISNTGAGGGPSPSVSQGPRSGSPSSSFPPVMKSKGGSIDKALGLAMRASKKMGLHLSQ
jgi:hypothetical protein